MLEFHVDQKRYFEMQYANAVEYVLPFIEQSYSIQSGCNVLEIGCGNGGVLKAFAEKGCRCVGVDLNNNSLKVASDYLHQYIINEQIKLISKDIYTVDPQLEFGSLFDVIVLKDVIEHIFDQQKLIAWMKTFLKPSGVVFFGFPPWQMPFGGHQQVCSSKILSKLPYFHLLPMPVYKFVLKSFKENSTELIEIKLTGISIERFEKIVQKTGFTILQRQHYLFNPVYKHKFNVQAKKQYGWLSSIPYLRNYFTTCAYYLIQA